ncbi:MAG: hypothetical protein Unbinned2480contig1002_23 [Prokaryotic dsDNA virus sp.]|nr:MAG: hypothetical protein Tp162SUR1511541_47 [Prokaryotic dsDNA virus sp.]QDP63769.1 MAG: hypothetical protein Unbinned2480contig1002_23 [Prokaryotic dsDNA virus sp.]QDP63817.1 MAG: hypothetical protein GOVbin2429_1 [Prokaryotic dsDNA virus sp.]|tara:strand:+ start:21052 stop:21288 length:237 start_codon:yes stop_codon:yes gene_type:complete
MEFKYNIELIRFKKSGKYYDTVTFATNSNMVFDVSDEIEEAFNSNVISQEFDYMITGEGFPDTGYPALLKLASSKVSQ